MVFDKERAKEAGKRSGEARRRKARERRRDLNPGPPAPKARRGCARCSPPSRILHNIAYGISRVSLFRLCILHATLTDSLHL